MGALTTEPEITSASPFIKWNCLFLCPQCFKTEGVFFFCFPPAPLYSQILSYSPVTTVQVNYCSTKATAERWSHISASFHRVCLHSRQTPGTNNCPATHLAAGGNYQVHIPSESRRVADKRCGPLLFVESPNRRHETFFGLGELISGSYLSQMTENFHFPLLGKMHSETI